MGNRSGCHLDSSSGCEVSLRRCVSKTECDSFITTRTNSCIDRFSILSIFYTTLRVSHRKPGELGFCSREARERTLNPIESQSVKAAPIFPHPDKPSVSGSGFVVFAGYNTWKHTEFWSCDLADRLGEFVLFSIKTNIFSRGVLLLASWQIYLWVSCTLNISWNLLASILRSILWSFVVILV